MATYNYGRIPIVWTSKNLSMEQMNELHSMTRSCKEHLESVRDLQKFWVHYINSRWSHIRAAPIDQDGPVYTWINIKIMVDEKKSPIGPDGLTHSHHKLRWIPVKLHVAETYVDTIRRFIEGRGLKCTFLSENPFVKASGLAEMEASFSKIPVKYVRSIGSLHIEILQQDFVTFVEELAAHFDGLVQCVWSRTRTCMTLNFSELWSCLKYGPDYIHRDLEWPPNIRKHV